MSLESQVGTKEFDLSGQGSGSKPLIWGPKVLSKNTNSRLKFGLFFEIREFLFNFSSWCSPNTKWLGDTVLGVSKGL